MSEKQLKGTGVALVTPFKNGGVDYPALEKVIRHCSDDGADYLVSLGTTGESPTISKEERMDILDFTVKVNNGKLPIVAGVGGNNTRSIRQFLGEYHFDGVDAILSSSPAYSKPTQEGIFRHYMALAEAAPRPIIIYNVPSRTCANISADTTLRLARASERFIGIKEAAYDLGQASRVLKHRPKGFLVLSGDDTLALPLLSIGGDGVISVIANAIPQLFAKMIRAGLGGDFDAARRIHLRINDVHQWLYAEGNPAGIKAMMEIMGICGSETRLPLCPISPETRQGLRASLEDANLILPQTAIA